MLGTSAFSARTEFSVTTGSLNCLEARFWKVFLGPESIPICTIRMLNQFRQCGPMSLTPSVIGDRPSPSKTAAGIGGLSSFHGL